MIAQPSSAESYLFAEVLGIDARGNLKTHYGPMRLANRLIQRPPDPHGVAALAHLKRRYVGGTLMISRLGDPDRYGVSPIEVAMPDTALLSAGHARVRPEPASDLHLDSLFAAEREARVAGRGLWAEAMYAVRSPEPDALAQDMDSWQIVEGLVVEAQKRGGRTFLNFGSDWRTDFTVVVSEAVAIRMEVPPNDLAGATVEVRGWIEMVNGPSMWLDHPRALRVMA